MAPVFIEGIGVWMPGLPDWPHARAVLRGEAPLAQDTARFSGSLLTGELRRRSGDHIRLAVHVAKEAVSHALADATRLASVFASSESDGQVTHHICEQVALPQPQVSPTRFHNSVNNAAAGYWSMAVQSLRPSTSVAGFDATFAVGLLEACAQAVVENEPVLLVVHDMPMPEPLHGVRPLNTSAGIAWVLSPTRSARSLAALTPTIAARGSETPLADAALEQLRVGNPAARALPAMATIARLESAQVALPYVGGQLLSLDIAACN